MLDTVSAVSTAVAALAAVVAAFIAVGALRATRRSVLVDQLVSAYGDMLAALAELTDLARGLSGRLDGAARSREVLRDSFRRFRVAADRLAVIEPTVGPYPDYGDWIRGVRTTSRRIFCRPMSGNGRSGIPRISLSFAQMEYRTMSGHISRFLAPISVSSSLACRFRVPSRRIMRILSCGGALGFLRVGAKISSMSTASRHLILCRRADFSTTMCGSTSSLGLDESLGPSGVETLRGQRLRDSQGVWG